MINERTRTTSGEGGAECDRCRMNGCNVLREGIHERNISDMENVKDHPPRMNPALHQAVARRVVRCVEAMVRFSHDEQYNDIRHLIPVNGLQDLLNKIGMSDDEFSAIERGEKPMGLDKLVDICQVLKVSPDMLLKGQIRLDK